jgi:hypothetical protein
MAIILIVEDGTVVADANTFINLADARVKVEALGLTLSIDDDTANAQLTQGYYQLVRSYNNKLAGSLISAVQTGVMPRSGIYANGFLVDSDSIPNDFINAQLCYSDAINKDADMNATQSDQELAAFNLHGVVSEIYKANSNARTTPNVPAVTQWLQAYLSNSGNTVNRDDFFANTALGGGYVCI